MRDTSSGYLLSYGKLGNILLKRGLVTEAQLDQALKQQRVKGGRLGDILLELELITEDDLAEVLAEQLNISAITSKSRVNVSNETLAILPETMAYQYNVLPLAKTGNSLDLAMANPFDVPTIDALKNYTGLDINPVIITNTELQRLLRRYYAEAAERSTLKSIIKEAAAVPDVALKQAPEDDVDVEALRQEVEAAPLVRLVDFIISNAINERASDIHIEPEEDHLSIRYRIDGVLHEITKTHRRLHMAVVSRIKIISALDIAEHRLPQDGRFSLQLQKKRVDLRVSTFPTRNGEKVVLRLLEQGSMSYKLENLGFDKGSLTVFRRHIHQPYGMILLTGPTGSGKTTTLYSALLEVKSPKVNVLTVEDPVEYSLSGVYQMQVNPKINLTFAAGLRSILRQDPDIIMVGEIRDLETAQMAIRAALTGHLVFSTLHTNDAISTVNRLIDMGIEPYLICSVLSLAAAQRLVRRICPSCKEAYTPTRDEFKALGIPTKKGAKLYRGKGCDKCHFTGYFGRVAIVELFELSEQRKQMILKGEIGEEIRRQAVKDGMQSIRENGMQKALQGMTTIADVMRVCLENQL